MKSEGRKRGGVKVQMARRAAGMAGTEALPCFEAFTGEEVQPLGIYAEGMVRRSHGSLGQGWDRSRWGW